jgi:dolichol kinase
MFYPLILYAIYAGALVILAYRLAKITEFRETVIFAGILILSILIFRYEQTNVALLVSGVIIFNAIITSYGKRRCYLFIAIALLYAFLAYPIGAAFMLQSLFLGMLSGSNIRQEKAKSTHKGNELSRNAVQLMAGIFLIAIFYFLTENIADAILFWFVIIGSLLGNYALSRKSGKLAKVLYSFERHDTILGSGARWLAIGALVAASFLTRNAIIAVFSAIFLADSFSTLVGVNLRTPKLPYNSRKSVGGTLAYFFTVLIVSYFFIGPIAVFLAIVAALLESQPFHIDDNFDVAFAMAVLFIVLAYFGIVAL